MKIMCEQCGQLGYPHQGQAWTGQLADFLTAHYTRAPYTQGVPFQTIRAAYIAWADQEGEYVLGNPRMGVQLLQAHLNQRTHTKARSWYWGLTPIENPTL